MWRQPGSGYANSPIWRLFMVALLACVLALAACSSGGGDPTQAAQTPASNLSVIARPAQLAPYHIFVTDLASGNVAELGVRTYHNAASVHGLGLSTDRHWLYATDVADNQLLAYPFNGAALGAPKRVTVGSFPAHMGNTLDGKRIFVTDFQGSSVSVIDTATWTVEKTIATPAGPHGIVLSPDGRYAYVACYDAGSIIAIDTANERIAATIPLPTGAHPYGVAISPDGRDVYAADNFLSRLYAINTLTNTVIASLAIGLHPALIARSPDGHTLYVANGVSHSVSIVNITQPDIPAIAGTVTVSGYPHGLAVTPDGRYVVVAQQYGKTLSVISTQSDSVVSVITGMQYPIDVLITP